MDLVSQVLHWVTVTLVGVMLLAAFSAGRLPRLRRVGLIAAGAALASMTLLLALRWARVGHPPLFGTFENTLAASWCLLVFGLAAARYGRGLRDSWRICAFWAAVLVAWGVRFRQTPVPLTISEQSIWVDIHVVFAWAAFVPLLVAGSMAVLQLLPWTADEERRITSETLRALLVVGFVALTGMLATGAWYLNVLFGTLWQWGIVETLSLIAWLLYTVVLHGLLFRRWSGRKLLVPLSLLVPLLLLAYWVWSVFPGTFHFFDIPLVRPY